MFMPTESMNDEVAPEEGSAAQSRYESGLPTVTATTITAMRIAESSPVDTRNGRRESKYRMYEIVM
jgi:hypothetical protein